MATSFNDLYKARVNAFGQEPVDSATYRALHEGAYTGALADYAGMTGGGTTVSPTTVRSLTRPTLPMSVLSGGTSYSGMKTLPGGSSGATPGTPETPIAPAPPTPYNLPVYDTSKVEGLAQRFATPGIRNLRHSMQDVQQGAYDNPNVKRMTLRDALAGYGQGLESVMAGALKEGTNVYGQQYGAEVSKAGAEFGAGEARVLQGTSIASQERMQGRGITSQETMQGRSLASQEAMHASSLASNETLTKYNNEWRAYLASLT